MTEQINYPCPQVLVLAFIPIQAVVKYGCSAGLHVTVAGAEHAKFG